MNTAGIASPSLKGDVSLDSQVERNALEIISEEIQARSNEILKQVTEQLQEQRLPVATYRIQFNKNFTLRQAEAAIPYLAELGVTDLYISPLLKAAPGSGHGYDVVAHDLLNPEIGTSDDLKRLSQSLKRHRMGLVLDIVPNHMNVGSAENVWWNDVLENGPSSRYANHFDISWSPLKPDLIDKVLLPVLGNQFGKVLEEGQLRLSIVEGAFQLDCPHRSYPLTPGSYFSILGHRLEVLRERLSSDDPDLGEYLSILTAIENLPGMNETAASRLEERRREKEVIKRRLRELLDRAPEIAAFVHENLAEINGCPGEPQSFDLLEKILDQQAYRLSYWRVAADEINYRRFFDVNDLGAIRVESRAVFEATHRLIFEWIEQGIVQGLRVDHPDGLFDPTTYLRRLQRQRFLQLCRATESFSSVAEGTQRERLEEVLLQLWNAGTHLVGSPLARPLYVVVEKIVEPGESFPANWQVHGTVGYEFLNVLNGVFVDMSAEVAFSRLYTRLTGESTDFRELAYLCKRLIVRIAMASEMNVLAHQLDRISEENRWTRDFTLNSLTRALQEVIAAFEVYRTYVHQQPVLQRDRESIETAMAGAKQRNLAMSDSVFDFLRDILLLEFPRRDDSERQAVEQFVGKFQQLTGPIMAKAIEDTAFYRYVRLVSLNEVGGAPDRFGNSVRDFHEMNQRRLPAFSHGMSSTSTHDTKRSEDVRARINVFSEIPREWGQAANGWFRAHRRLKTRVAGQLAPGRAEEYLLYQTLIGTWPNEGLSADYLQRVRDYMLKVVREAKVNTSWLNPHEAYEAALVKLIEELLRGKQGRKFVRELEELAHKVRRHGRWNSLTQVVLKIGAPGVPDLYQGTEMECLTLVDPDNRHPVDFERCRQVLQETCRWEGDFTGQNLEAAVQESFDALKMFVTQRCLQLRRSAPELLTQGAYLPLEASGPHAERVIALARFTGEGGVLIAVPRLTVGLCGFGTGIPCGDCWGETTILLPEEFRRKFSKREFRNIFTGKCYRIEEEGVAVRDLLRQFPVAVLTSFSLC